MIASESNRLRPTEVTAVVARPLRRAGSLRLYRPRPSFISGGFDLAWSGSDTLPQGHCTLPWRGTHGRLQKSLQQSLTRHILAGLTCPLLPKKVRQVETRQAIARVACLPFWPEDVERRTFGVPPVSDKTGSWNPLAGFDDAPPLKKKATEDSSDARKKRKLRVENQSATDTIRPPYSLTFAANTWLLVTMPGRTRAWLTKIRLWPRSTKQWTNAIGSRLSSKLTRCMRDSETIRVFKHRSSASW